MKTRTHRVRIALACVVAAASLAAGDLAAQPYPTRIIRVINPAAPGGNVDFVFLVDKLNSAIVQALRDTAIRKMLTEITFSIGLLGGADKLNGR